MNRQWARSPAEPCINLGYQAIGTEIDRPSDSSTASVSSDRVTDEA